MSNTLAITAENKPRSFIRRAIANLALLVVSLLAFLLFCEFIVFRFLIPGADYEANAFIDNVIRYEPGLAGTFRRADEIEARFAFNQDGWNSPHASYALERTPGVKRIAIIGDSYVHAREVDVDKSFSEQLERDLAEQPGSLEIYRFAIKGAPLSQYLHMLREEVARYQPDLVVVMLIHNDFDQSFKPIWGRYIQSFMHLNIEDGQVVGEKAPIPYEPGWADVISSSATYATLQRRYGAVATVRNLLLDATSDDDAEPVVYQANVNVAEVASVMDDIVVATDYVFSSFKAYAEEHDLPIALVMDGHRDVIYTGAGVDADTVPLALNRLSAETADKHGLPFLDLHPAFVNDWNANKTSFNFDTDGHWNEYGHRLVADTIESWLREENGLLP